MLIEARGSVPLTGYQLATSNRMETITHPILLSRKYGLFSPPELLRQPLVAIVRRIRFGGVDAQAAEACDAIMGTALKFVVFGVVAFGVVFAVVWGITKVMLHFVSEEAALVFMLWFSAFLFALACVLALGLELYYQRHRGKRR
jgi:hypothetical protein